MICRITILTRANSRGIFDHVRCISTSRIHMYACMYIHMPWTFAGSRTGDYKIFNMPYGRVAIAINDNYVYPAGGCEITERNCLSIARNRWATADDDDDDDNEDLDASHGIASHREVYKRKQHNKTLMEAEMSIARRLDASRQIWIACRLSEIVIVFAIGFARIRIVVVWLMDLRRRVNAFADCYTNATMSSRELRLNRDRNNNSDDVNFCLITITIVKQELQDKNCRIYDCGNLNWSFYAKFHHKFCSYIFNNYLNINKNNLCNNGNLCAKGD